MSTISSRLIGNILDANIALRRQRLAISNARMLQPSPQCWTKMGNPNNGVESRDKMFGRSVSMSMDGSSIAVSGYDDTVDNGYVRVFEYDAYTGLWRQLGFDIMGDRLGDQFATSMDMAKDNDGSLWLIAGAPNANSEYLAGYARIYEWDGSDWTLTATLNGEEVADRFGTSVSISAGAGGVGNVKRAVVGVPGHRAGTSGTGRVQFYEWNGFDWLEMGDLEGEDVGADYGWPVTISANGTRVAIASRDLVRADSDLFAIHARVVDWAESNVAVIGDEMESISFDAWSDLYSFTLSANGDRLAVGIPSGDGVNAPGRARVYELLGSTWTRAGDDIDSVGEADSIGYSVAMSSNGRRLAVGDWSSTSLDGRVRVFDWDDDAGWMMMLGGEFTSRDAGNSFGRSLSMSGDGARIVVGAPAWENGIGQAIVFKDICGPTPTPSFSPAPKSYITVGGASGGGGGGGDGDGDGDDGSSGRGDGDGGGGGVDNGGDDQGVANGLPYIPGPAPPSTPCPPLSPIYGGPMREDVPCCHCCCLGFVPSMAIQPILTAAPVLTAGPVLPPEPFPREPFPPVSFPTPPTWIEPPSNQQKPPPAPNPPQAGNEDDDFPLIASVLLIVAAVVVAIILRGRVIPRPW